MYSCTMVHKHGGSKLLSIISREILCRYFNAFVKKIFSAYVKKTLFYDLAW